MKTGNPFFNQKPKLTNVPLQHGKLSGENGRYNVRTPAGQGELPRKPLARKISAGDTGCVILMGGKTVQ
jgi:hypothetical protein